MTSGVRGSRPTCKVPGCNNKAHGKGLCSKHYFRVRYHGDYYLKKTKDFSPEFIKASTERLMKYHNSPEGKAFYKEHMRRVGKLNKTKSSAKHMEKMTKHSYKRLNKIANDRDFYTTFIKKHCPEIDTDDNMPISIYKELIEFFHPELLPTLEREWRLFLED